MYGIKYNLQGGLEMYLAEKRNGEFTTSECRKDIAEFEDEYEAIYEAVENAKRIYGKNVEFTLLWHA